MLLTIASTARPATDLGYLLHKNPSRVQSFELAFGSATVFYPEASEDRCTAALLLHVDPVGVVRGRKGAESSFTLDQYVNDRPYASTSLLSVAMARVFGTAMAGNCAKRPDLVERALPLEAGVTALPSRGGPELIRRLFEPLGYRVDLRRHELDPTFPEWGESPYHDVRIRGEVRLRDLLSHLYVLIPVLDNDKHYWVGEPEVEKLLRRGEGWLPEHPEQALIARRYLKHRRSLINAALSRLLERDASKDEDRRETRDREEEAVEQPMRLNEIRLDTVTDRLRAIGAMRVLDLGCGGGKLLRLLLGDKTFTEIVGVDVSHRALELARRRLHWDRMPERQRSRIRLLHGALTYRDRRLEGFDAAAAVEVIEHLDPSRLHSFERVVFECARPGAVIVTTPNREYNVRFEQLPAGKLRHRDHRFEWTREEFRTWGDDVGARFGYTVAYEPVGPVDADLGAPTQMAVFRR